MQGGSKAKGVRTEPEDTHPELGKHKEALRSLRDDFEHARNLLVQSASIENELLSTENAMDAVAEKMDNSPAAQAEIRRLNDRQLTLRAQLANRTRHRQEAEAALQKRLSG